MCGKEVDAGGWRAVAAAENVGRARDARGKGTRDVGIAAPEAAHLVAVAIVPLLPARRKVPELIATRPHVPWLRNHDEAGEQRVLLDGAEQRCMRAEARDRAAHHGGEVEAEAVDPRAHRPAAQGIHRQLQHGGLIQRQRIAAARIIDELTIGVAITQRLIQPAQRQRGAVNVALARMVQHHVQHHADPRCVQGIDRGADLREPARCEPRVWSEETHRVVAPGIGKAEGRQVPLVDPRRKRHQLHRVDVQPRQMFDDHRFCKRRHRAARLRRHIRVQHGEALDRNFIDEPWPVRRQRLRVCRRMPCNGLRHEQRGLGAALHQVRQMAEWSGDLRCIGVEQQFPGVEALATLWVPWPLGAQSVMHARHKTRNEAEMHIPQSMIKSNARRLQRAVEQRNQDARGMARHHGDIGAAGGRRDAEWKGQGLYGVHAQVITVGAARPVRASIPASARDSAMRSASAACVSMAWRLASGS